MCTRSRPLYPSVVSLSVVVRSTRGSPCHPSRPCSHAVVPSRPFHPLYPSQRTRPVVPSLLSVLVVRSFVPSMLSFGVVSSRPLCPFPSGPFPWCPPPSKWSGVLCNPCVFAGPSVRLSSSLVVSLPLVYRCTGLSSLGGVSTLPWTKCMALGSVRRSCHCASSDGLPVRSAVRRVEGRCCCQ